MRQCDKPSIKWCDNAISPGDDLVGVMTESFISYDISMRHIFVGGCRNLTLSSLFRDNLYSIFIRPFLLLILWVFRREFSYFYLSVGHHREGHKITEIVNQTTMAAAARTTCWPVLCFHFQASVHSKFMEKLVFVVCIGSCCPMSDYRARKHAISILLLFNFTGIPLYFYVKQLKFYETENRVLLFWKRLHNKN